ncbi:SRPBCC family protein [Amycolatopsis nigrescens]|uniref:SRPBCC family protein n=1 Tax=Amycolatopsis nigrescens TaxID=381445 RepID=UPI000477724C|nr:SRPBCC domain-containing protein [Amycolatopsis nigrescens]
MSREFEIGKEVVLDATPEQVWQAIATPEGTAGWLWPVEIEPEPGGQAGEGASVVAVWEPGKRLVIKAPGAAEGTLDAFEYLIEARDGGSTVLRFVHSGVLADDWDDDYESLTGHGWDMYLHTLGQYLKYFAGRPATYVEAEGPAASADPGAFRLLLDALGLTEFALGDRVRLTPDGLAPIEGVVDYVVPPVDGQPVFLGVRAADAMYRFHGRAVLGMPIAVGHHFYGEPDAPSAWHDLLERALG